MDVVLMRHAWEKAGLLNRMRVVGDGEQAIKYLSGAEPYADREKYPVPCLVLLD